MLNFRGVKPVVLPVFVSHTPCLACCVANTLVSKWRKASNKNQWQRWTKIPAITILPETKTACLPLKIDGWETIFSSWVSAYLQSENVSFRGANQCFLIIRNCCSPMGNVQKLKFSPNNWLWRWFTTSIPKNPAPNLRQRKTALTGFGGQGANGLGGLIHPPKDNIDIPIIMGVSKNRGTPKWMA